MIPSMKTWQIVRRLLYQNRWLYLLLMLLPPGLATLILLTGTPPDLGDVLSILHQGCLYGIALVVFSASVQLGNEQRSRRIVAVLSRAVSRRQYLFALLFAAWIPLVLYAASLLASGLFLIAGTSQPRAGLLAMTFALLLLGLWAAAASLFFAAWLPSFLATMAALALVSATALSGHIGFGPGKLLSAILGMDPNGEMAIRPAGGISDALMILVAAVAFFAAAAAIFSRRDLRLKDD